MPVCAGCGYESAEPFRFCPSCGEKQQLDGREVRKTVTTLFSDVVGSTSLGEAVESELPRRAPLSLSGLSIQRKASPATARSAARVAENAPR